LSAQLHSGKVAVIGGGSWGTALVQLISNNGYAVSWWVRSQATANHIRKTRHNPHYLSSASINLNRVSVGTDINGLISEADWVILAVPAAFLHSSLQALKPGILAHKTILSAVKGIIPETLSPVTEYLVTNHGLLPSQVGVLGGPCHSEEVVMQKLSFLTLAFRDIMKAKRMAEMMTNRYMKVSTTTDVSGLEYSAILKNVYAIGSGMALGLGYGDNFQAVLVVNSMQEMLGFIRVVNGSKDDSCVLNLTGDLIVTSYSGFSRNRHFGSLVGKGYSLKSILDEMDMVAEGYYASRCIHDLRSKLGLNLPICEMVYRVLHENASPAREMDALAQRLN
jgi:glycerol-3-phosphate dehydrogenase (NAD(P)+)